LQKLHLAAAAAEARAANTIAILGRYTGPHHGVRTSGTPFEKGAHGGRRAIRSWAESAFPGRLLSCEMPSKSPAIRRYSIVIKDPDNKSVLFTATDWTDEEKRIAVAQILRLAGQPDDNRITAPAAEPASGGET
jgi:hypothetical protein